MSPQLRDVIDDVIGRLEIVRKLPAAPDPRGFHPEPLGSVNVGYRGLSPTNKTCSGDKSPVSSNASRKILGSGFL